MEIRQKIHTMSEPRRYKHSVTKDGTDSLLFDPAFDAPTTLAPMGEYVRYEDYSKLKEDAERYRLASLRTDVDRLHAEFKRDLLNQTITENTRLQEQVDKLIQAGDAVYQVLFHRRDDPALSCMVAEQWYKAKGLIP